MTSVFRPAYTPIVSSTETIPMPQPKVNNLPFIEANTKEVEMSHLTGECIIPVFS